MRLWHEDMISKLPRQQLLGQHRECCALRGKGWGKPHATVNYVFTYSPYKLYQYHMIVMNEMEARGYKPLSLWKDKNYRGKIAPTYENLPEEPITLPLYAEHDDAYLDECFLNLEEKHIFLER